jgi:hypothetical protein
MKIIRIFFEGDMCDENSTNLFRGDMGDANYMNFILRAT